MIVYAFDVDGTLSSSAGPVPLDDLRELVRRGHAVVIVSPSTNCPEEWPRCSDGERTANLREARKQYPDAAQYIYVSDNPGDEEVAFGANYKLVRPEDWELR